MLLGALGVLKDKERFAVILMQHGRIPFQTQRNCIVNPVI
jgi:hypothetical protein